MRQQTQAGLQILINNSLFSNNDTLINNDSNNLRNFEQSIFKWNSYSDDDDMEKAIKMSLEPNSEDDQNKNILNNGGKCEPGKSRMKSKIVDIKIDCRNSGNNENNGENEETFEFSFNDDINGSKSDFMEERLANNRSQRNVAQLDTPMKMEEKEAQNRNNNNQLKHEKHPICICGNELNQTQLNQVYGNEKIENVENFKFGFCGCCIKPFEYLADQYKTEKEKKELKFYICYNIGHQHGKPYSLCAICAQKQLKGLKEKVCEICHTHFSPIVKSDEKRIVTRSQSKNIRKSRISCRYCERNMDAINCQMYKCESCDSGNENLCEICLTNNDTILLKRRNEIDNEIIDCINNEKLNESGSLFGNKNNDENNNENGESDSERSDESSDRRGKWYNNNNNDKKKKRSNNKSGSLLKGAARMKGEKRLERMKRMDKVKQEREERRKENEENNKNNNNIATNSEISGKTKHNKFGNDMELEEPWPPQKKRRISEKNEKNNNLQREYGGNNGNYIFGASYINGNATSSLSSRQEQDRLGDRLESIIQDAINSTNQTVNANNNGQSNITINIFKLVLGTSFEHNINTNSNNVCSTSFGSNDNRINIERK